jgi:ADP-ribosylglycohydrolase
VLGGTNYGRDADSIASMAGAVTGALGGQAGVPGEWAAAIADASGTDLVEPGRVMASVATELHEADSRRWAQRTETLERLAG